MYQHTGGDVATLSKITLMSTEDLPTVVVHVLNVGVGAFEVRDAILVPWGIIAEVLGGERLGVECTFEEW